MPQTNVQGIGNFFTGLSALLGGPKALDVARASVLGAQRENFQADSAKRLAETGQINDERSSMSGLQAILADPQAPALLATEEGRARLMSKMVGTKGGLQYGPSAATGAMTFINPRAMAPADLSTTLLGTGVVKSYGDTPTGFGVDQLRQKQQSDDKLAADERMNTYTQDQKLAGDKYGADAKAGADKYGYDVKAGADRYAADQKAGADKYGYDQKLAGDKYGADAKAGADRYGYDVKAGSDRYKADQDLTGTRYSADQKLVGDKYQADKSLAGTLATRTDKRDVNASEADNIAAVVDQRIAATVGRPDLKGAVVDPRMRNAILQEVAVGIRRTGNVEAAIQMALQKFQPKLNSPWIFGSDTVYQGNKDAQPTSMADVFAPPVMAPPDNNIPPPPAGSTAAAPAQPQGVPLPPQYANVPDGQVLTSPSTGRSFKRVGNTLVEVTGAR